MNSPTDSMSPWTPQYFLPCSGLAGAAVAGADGVDEHEVGVVEPGVLVVDQLVGRRAASAPSARIFTRFGPSAPRCSHTDDEPGPPLNENISGRASGPPLRSSV